MKTEIFDHVRSKFNLTNINVVSHSNLLDANWSMVRAGFRERTEMVELM